MIVKNIKRLCEEHNTSLWALERATGIGNGVIARWDKATPRIDGIQKVADYFGVTLDEIVRDDEHGDS